MAIEATRASGRPTKRLSYREACEAFAARTGVGDEKLREPIRMVGSRITTFASYLKV